jgi:hypothetical protein
MRVTYFALKPVRVGEDQREPGDLVPEARDWPYLSGYIQDGTLAPVLVATLPDEQQMMLLEWADEQEQAAKAAQVEAEKKAKAAQSKTKQSDKQPEKVSA